MGSFFGLFTQLSGSLLKVNEWFLPPWKLACTPSWMSPQNASSESSSSKHEELSKPSPEKKDIKSSTRTWTHKLVFWFVFQFSLFNLNFSPPRRTYVGQDRLPISEVGETHFPLSRFNDFFFTKRVGRDSTRIIHFSPSGG